MARELPPDDRRGGTQVRLTLPGSSRLPPITDIRPTLANVFGSFCHAFAKFVNGPTAAICTVPTGSLSKMSRIACDASVSSRGIMWKGCASTSGKGFPGSSDTEDSPSFPWLKGKRSTESDRRIEEGSEAVTTYKYEAVK